MANKLAVVPDRSSEVLFSLTDRLSGLPEKSVVPSRECQAWVAVMAGERLWTDTRESWFHRAARGSNLPYRTIRAIYYGEITDPEHPSMVALKSAAERHEIEQFADRLEQLAGRIRRMLGTRR